MLRSSVLENGWQFASRRWLTPPSSFGYSTLDWLPARVPGHVHLDLMAQGILADPYRRAYELGARWVDEEDWVYRTEFEYTADPTLPRVLLEFSGLDTLCSIHLNGELLARHDNMFLPLSVDVGSRVVAGKNELSVHFESALRAGAERRSRYLEREGLSPTTVRFDERAFVRKAQYMFGWDWGPRLISAGICGEVRLIQHAGRIQDIEVRQRHLADGSVELLFLSEVEGRGQVVHSIEGEPGWVRDGEPISIQKPRLWWPAGLGEPALYRVTSRLLPEGCDPGAELESSTLDLRETKLGLRRLRLLRTPDDHGESFEFEINDQRLWAVGANWIPDSSFPASVSLVELRGQLQRARDLNMNMLRVWGGGFYESDAFYDACDELGLLVWQDFPYACSYYPDDSEAREVARREATFQIRRLRNRASLAIWCGNNENLVMHQDKWDDATRHPPRYHGERIYDGVLPELLAALDPERAYIPSSPCGGDRANVGGIGDQHYWDVWHGQGDWKHYDGSTGRFISEFGFASAPGPQTWRRIEPDEPEVLKLPVRHPSARWHDKTRKGYETFIRYVELHYPEASDLEDWLYFSQLNQRDALRHGIEHFRRSQFCRGALIWQLNDCWPVQSWAVIDSAHQLKAAAYELKRLYASALASLERSGDRIRLWAILDNAQQPLSAQVELSVHSLIDGRRLAEQSAEIVLSPGDRRVVLELECQRFEPRTTLIVAHLQGTTTFRLLCEPKEVTFRQEELRVSELGEELWISSQVPVVDLYLRDETGSAAFEENFLTLPEPGEISVRMRGNLGRLVARSLAGRHPVRVERA